MKLIQRILLILLLIGVLGLAGTAIVRSGQEIAETDRLIDRIDQKLAMWERR